MEKLPISAVVVSLNEEHLLKPCLEALSFCDEVILIDLNSDDESVTIGRNCGAKVITRPRAEYVEVNQCWVVDKVKHDWILYIDPDEVIDNTLAEVIVSLFLNIPEDVGQVRIPLQYYYKDKPLKGTIWGGDKYKDSLVNRKRIIVQDKIFKRFQLQPGFQSTTIKRKVKNIIHHYWMIDGKAFIEKHKRYLRVNKKNRYEEGLRFNIRQLFSKTIRSFYYCYIKHKGYRDGYTGLMLSIFWAWYNFMGVYMLRNFDPNTHD